MAFHVFFFEATPGGPRLRGKRRRADLARVGNIRIRFRPVTMDGRAGGRYVCLLHHTGPVAFFGNVKLYRPQLAGAIPATLFSSRPRIVKPRYSRHLTRLVPTVCRKVHARWTICQVLTRTDHSGFPPRKNRTIQKNCRRGPVRLRLLWRVGLSWWRSPFGGAFRQTGGKCDDLFGFDLSFRCISRTQRSSSVPFVHVCGTAFRRAAVHALAVFAPTGKVVLDLLVHRVAASGPFQDPVSVQPHVLIGVKVVLFQDVDT